jgi:hypothetical protein
VPDFYVAALRYHVEPCEGVEFVNPPPLERETSLFRMKLDAGTLMFEMKTHFDTAAEAKAAVAPFLREWEIAQYIHSGRKQMEIVYERADIVDRDPPTDGSQYIFPEAVSSLAMAMEARAIVCVPEYPAPIMPFEATPLVELLWNKYKEFRAGRWPFLAMAYYCYTAINSYGSSTQGKKGAAKTYNIEPVVLRTLSELTSTHGDEATARKLPSKNPLTPPEQEWVDAAVRSLIRRAGEVGAGAVTARIRMADLPKL